MMYDLLEMLPRFPRTLAVDPILGIVKRCSRCEEWWPATTEFFSPTPNKPPGLHTWCKACSAEWKAQRRPVSRHRHQVVP